MVNQHIVKHPNGEWRVKGAGNDKFTVRTDTQAEAINLGKNIAINQGGELFIHGTNGRIRERNTFGNDPFPPIG